MDLLLRTTVILAATWAACRLMPRATAATRHLLWHLAILAVLVAPIASRVIPTFETPLAPSTTVTFTTLPDIAKPVVQPATRAAAQVDVTKVWPIGSILLLIWYASGHVIGAWRIRRVRLAPEPLQSAAEALAGRQVRVLIADGDHGPFVRGVFRGTIVLPAAAETWDADRKRTVLLHELAHLRRGDCRVQLLAQIACAVYWFNPLIWIAARALRIEREHACDDEVLARGATPSAYAADLLDLARRRQLRPASLSVLAMARASDLESRLVAILTSGRALTPRRATKFAVTLAFCSLAVVVSGARRPEVRQPSAASAVLQPDDDPERAAMRLALDSSPDAVPGLIAALKDSDSQVREKAALGLGWRSDQRVLQPLITALRDNDSQVREKAAIALGSLADPRAVAPLEAALKDPDSQVREKAATGLMLLRMGGHPDANGKEVRAALSGIVNGLLQLTK
jgi:beta-lactamase regulating signal transducer with metallopeptidase domain